jgi:prepilin-type N-terminal cleavage/methylation domain-containing protein
MEFCQHFITRKTSQAGLTMVEVLLVVAVVSIMAAYGSSGLMASHKRAQQKTAGEFVMTVVREAQSRSLAAQGGNGWAIQCPGDNTILDIDYTAGVPQPQIFSLPSGYSCTATVNPIRFQKLTGIPEADSVISLSSNGQVVQQIEVKRPGLISFINL